MAVCRFVFRLCLFGVEVSLSFALRRLRFRNLNGKESCTECSGHCAPPSGVSLHGTAPVLKRCDETTYIMHEYSVQIKSHEHFARSLCRNHNIPMCNLDCQKFSLESSLCDDHAKAECFWSGGSLLRRFDAAMRSNVPRDAQLLISEETMAALDELSETTLIQSACLRSFQGNNSGLSSSRNHIHCLERRPLFGMVSEISQALKKGTEPEIARSAGKC